MAGSSIFAWMLLLLPLFVSFDQISAAPAPPLCKDTFWVKAIQTNINALGEVVKKCGNLSLEVSSNVPNNQTTAGKPCSFPANFIHGLKLQPCYTESKINQIQTHMDHLEDRMKVAGNCSELMEIYCSKSANSGSIASLDVFHAKMKVVLEEYMAKLLS